MVFADSPGYSAASAAEHSGNAGVACALGQWLSATAAFTWQPASNDFSASAQLSEILGLKSSERPKFTTLLSRVHPEDVAAFRARLAHPGAGDITYELRLLLPDRTIRLVRVVWRATSDAADREIQGAIQDVTQLRECEAALAQARSDLAYAARVMSLGALSASIAHEIKQPLSGIITNAGTCLRMLAADPPDFAGARETARRTLRDGNRASAVITRLRALFTQKTVSGERVDLNEVAQEAITLALGDLHHRQITVRTQLSEELAPLRADRIQLHQVILNLILNAADAMADIEDHPRQLLICTQPAGPDRVQLSVVDTGTGLPAPETRLFEPFYTTKSDGMGIGLSISRAIIESHGGRLWASANQGPGATFCFCIPCNPRNPVPAPAFDPALANSTAPARAGAALW